MAMKFSDTEDDAIVAEINITPLTDVFLVLLIIFMLTSTAMMESGLQVKLPSAKSSAAANNDTQKPLFVTVDKDGHIRVNESPATDDNLGALLKAELEKTANKTVIIRGDEGILLGKAVQIMDLARNSGAEKIAVATQQAAAGK
jgi:biopolymer transport protein ExbD